METMLRPPTPTPTSTRSRASIIHQPVGVNTEARVKTVKSRTHQKKVRRRPIRSAARPHRTEPSTVPSPEQARMTPVSKPPRLHSFWSWTTAKPMRNMSKNSEMLATMARAMMLR